MCVCVCVSAKSGCDFSTDARRRPPLAMAGTVTPEQQYEAFVTSTLRHVRRGLDLDGTDKKQRVGTALDNSALDVNNFKNAAERVLEGRFALGGDDACYLQTGLSMLWTTATADPGYANADETLAPAGLYAPDAVDGIRQGLLQGLRDKSESMKNDAPAVLKQLVAPILALLGISTVGNAVRANLGLGRVADVVALVDLDWSAQAVWTQTNLDGLSDVLDALKSYFEANNDAQGGATLAGGIVDAINQQQVALQKQTAKVASLEQEKTQLEADVRAAVVATKTVRAIMQGQIDQCNADLVAAQSARNDEGRRRITAEQERSDAENARDVAVAARADAEKQRATAQQALGDAATAAATARARALAAEKSLAECEAKLAATGGASSAEVAALTAERDALQDAVSAAQAATAAARSATQAREEELQRADAAAAVSAKRMAELEGRLRTADETIDRASGRLERMAAQVLELTQRVEDLTREASDKEIAMERLRTQINDGGRAALDAAQQQATTARALQEAERKARDCEEKLTKARAENKSSTERIRALQSAATKAKEALEKQQRESATATTAVATTNEAQRQRLQELDNLLYSQADPLAAEWKVAMGNWIAELTAGSDEEERLAQAREIAKKLGTQSMRRILNEQIDDYALVEVYSTRAVIATSGLEKAVSPRDQAVCKALGDALRNNVPGFRNRIYAEATKMVCNTLRAWGLYKRSDSATLEKRGTKPLILHMPLCAEADTQGVFVPLTAEALQFVQNAEEGETRVGEVLNYLFNLPNDSEQERRWELQFLENTTFPHLFLNLKGSPLGAAMQVEQGFFSSKAAWLGGMISRAAGVFAGKNADAAAPKSPAANAAASEAAATEPVAANRLAAAVGGFSAAAKVAAATVAVAGAGVVAAGVIQEVASGGEPLPAFPNRTINEETIAGVRYFLDDFGMVAPSSVVTGIVGLEAAKQAKIGGSLVDSVAGTFAGSTLPTSIRALPTALQQAAEDGDDDAVQLLDRNAKDMSTPIDVLSLSSDEHRTAGCAAIVSLAAADNTFEVVERMAGGRVARFGTAQSYRKVANSTHLGNYTEIALQHVPLMMVVNSSVDTGKLATFREMRFQHDRYLADGGRARSFLERELPRRLALQDQSEPSLLLPEPDLPAPPPPLPMAVPRLVSAAEPRNYTMPPDVFAQTVPAAFSLRLSPNLLTKIAGEDTSDEAMVGLGVLSRQGLGPIVDELSGALFEKERPALVLPGALLDVRASQSGALGNASRAAAAKVVTRVLRERAERRRQAQPQPRPRELVRGEVEKMVYDAVTSSGSAAIRYGGQILNAGFSFLGALASENTEASYEDDLAMRIVVSRGLVGQRAPTERASPDCELDAVLKYELPDTEALARCMPAVRLLLETTPDPTSEEVRRALARRGSTGARAPVAASTRLRALHALDDNFAMVGKTAASIGDSRAGVEMPHAVRWMPTGSRAGAMARTAILEHAVARCAQAQAQAEAEGDSGIQCALAGAAAALKLRQLEELYGLIEAAQYDDEPHLLGTATPLVTRPCAVVRGVLSFPVDHGVASVDANEVKLDTSEEAPMGAATALAVAMEKTHVPTAQLRNALRRAAVTDASLYVAPPASELAFRPAPSRATSETGVRLDAYACQRVQSGDFSVAVWLRIVNRAIVHLDAMYGDQHGAIKNFLSAAAAGDVPGTFFSATHRRDALWSEFRRNVAISQDRLWVFVRLVSGCVGGDVNEVITMADEATLKATKAIQDQRVAIAKRVSDMQAKIVETVVGSMVRESKLTMDKNGANDLVVIDGAARKQLNDLASGESGRPFFEANVAVRHLKDPSSPANQETKLVDLLQSLANVGNQLQESLETTLTQSGSASASLTELSHPANCYYVSMRTDAIAAIRVAHERLNVELGMRRVLRRISLWELVEGGCTALTTRFAEFAGHVLVQARSATGTSALYVSQQAIQTNAYQARMALDKLVRAGVLYATRTGMPDFENLDSNAARRLAMDAGNGLTDLEIGEELARQLLPRGVKMAPSIHVHPSGWGAVGFPRR